MLLKLLLSLAISWNTLEMCCYLLKLLMLLTCLKLFQRKHDWMRQFTGPCRMENYSSLAGLDSELRETTLVSRLFNVVIQSDSLTFFGVILLQISTDFFLHLLLASCHPSPCIGNSHSVPCKALPDRLWKWSPQQCNESLLLYICLFAK